MIIPPYDGVRLVEFWDRLELAPVRWYRIIVGLGRFKASKVGFQPEEDMHPMFNEIMGDHEIWVVVSWNVFDDGTEEVGEVNYCDPETTLEEAQKQYHHVIEYLSLSQAGLNDFAEVLTERIPAIHSAADQKPGETMEMYQARLKVLAGIQPQTVALIQQADAAEDDTQRQKFEHEAVHAYFAEAATYWTDDMLKAWLKSNPPGSKWLLEFADMVKEPERELDPINHELAMHWIRRGYNLMTENELSDAILIATGQRLMPNTLKKKRTKLGLSTKRPPGPRQNSEQ